MSSCNVKLTKKLQHFTLDVDVTIPSSGITILFGPSGSGKTSVLNCIAGLTECVGDIYIGNITWLNNIAGNAMILKTFNRCMGYVFQESILFDTMTVQENLQYACNNKFGATDDQLTKLIQQFNIESLLQSKANKLSGGERQRVAIVRALIGNPSILLMDEPMASLDQSAKNDISKILLELKKSINIPILYVTHSVDDVIKLADHIGFIQQGVLKEILPINTGISKLNKSIEDSVLISGEVTDFDPKYMISTINSFGVEFLVPSQLAIGRDVVFRLHAKNISISQERNINSSILNNIEVDISDFKIDGAFVTLNLTTTTNKLQFFSKITKKSFDKLAIQKGRIYFAQIKSVNLI